MNSSLAKREKFTVEKAPGHSLSVTAYDEEGVMLELHRGKRWEGWLRTAPSIEDARTALKDYYDEPLNPSEGIEKHGEWLEVAVFHPAVYIVVAILITALIVWTTWFRH